MKSCSSCGRQLEDPERFCDGCGAPQPVVPKISYMPPRYPAQILRMPTLRSMLGLGVVLLIIGTAIGLGIGAASFSGQQSTITQRFTTTNTITSLQQVMVTRTTTSMIQLPGAGLIEYAFSPGGNCAGLVIKWIQRANSSIHVLIYSFTLDIVRDALIQAKNRGVEIKIVMDKEQAAGQGSEYATLKNAGINVRLDSNPHLMHDKVAIIDSHILLTGSFNWSVAGNEDNNENLVVLESQAWAASFEVQFQQIYNVATS